MPRLINSGFTQILSAQGVHWRTHCPRSADSVDYELPARQRVLGCLKWKHEARHQLRLEQVRFMNPVQVGANPHRRQAQSVRKSGMLEVINEMTVEIDGADKPAYVAGVCVLFLAVDLH